MKPEEIKKRLDETKQRYPEKFASEEAIFSRIHRGSRIFISTACGEPLHLSRTLINYVEAHPKAFFDAEILYVWTLGVAPYMDERYKRYFRCNSFPGLFNSSLDRL